MATAYVEISLSDTARAAIAALEPTDADMHLAATDAAIEVADELRASARSDADSLVGAALANRRIRGDTSIWFGLNRVPAEDVPFTVETPRGITVRGSLIPRSFRLASIAGRFFERLGVPRLPIRRLTVDIADELEPQIRATEQRAGGLYSEAFVKYMEARLGS